MKARTSCYSSSAACALLPVCNISHFCRTSTSPLHFHLCASRQQGKQQWAFYFDLSFGFPHDLSHDCSQTDISPLDSPPYRNQGVSFHHKTEDTSSSTWPSKFSLLFYHGYIWESIEIRGNVSTHILEKMRFSQNFFAHCPVSHENSR